MRTHARKIYWALMPLAIAAYIVAMAQPDEKRDDQRGPNDYANPRGNAWGYQHGKGPPSKTP